MSDQKWDEAQYDHHARFVSDLGTPVVQLLAPQPHERILDLGCGDGVLTQKLAAQGCRVIGVDASADFLRGARQRGLAVCCMDGQALAFDGAFEAVFSNAALHWMPRAEAVVRGVARALRPNGRFVAEFGGAGNVQTIRTALYQALQARGIDPAAYDHWYFPTDEAYRALLENNGFTVQTIQLIPRPTPLPTDIGGWLEMFAQRFWWAVPADEHASLLHELTETLRPHLCDSQGQWTADYVRLRFAAYKQ